METSSEVPISDTLQAQQARAQVNKGSKLTVSVPLDDPLQFLLGAGNRSRRTQSGIAGGVPEHASAADEQLCEDFSPDQLNWLSSSMVSGLNKIGSGVQNLEELQQVTLRDSQPQVMQLGADVNQQ